MRLTVYSSRSYDRDYLGRLAAKRDPSSAVEISFLDSSLSIETAALANGADAICIFVHDILDARVLRELHAIGVRAILLRCTGYNNVDLQEAERLGLFVANVPSYSPESVAEFAVALIQSLGRKTHHAYNRVRNGNFKLDGLLGQSLHGKIVGVVGTGKIGLAFARIMHGFGCEIMACDPSPSNEFARYGTYADLDTLLSHSDIVSLHCPLMDTTRDIINKTSLAKMKQGALLINTSRGGLIDADSAMSALKSRRLGGLAIDVYHREGGVFHDDHSQDIIEDDLLMRLTTFHNVIVTGHQAFFTEEALTEIAECTLQNLDAWSNEVPTRNALVSRWRSRSTGIASARL
nr:d-lactate dehydrogenase [Quercus suber]